MQKDPPACRSPASDLPRILEPEIPWRKRYASLLALMIGLMSTSAAEQVAGAQKPHEPTSDLVAPATRTAASAVITASPEKGLRINFRGARLDVVLDYLSKEAGFIIVPEVDVTGRVDVWSHQVLSRDEAYDLLNSVLKKNGLVALRHDRTLTIVSREEARKRDIPVKRGNVAAEIPKNDGMVTQIVGVRYVNATQLLNNLVQLLPSYATTTVNDSANALVLTATQTDVRRMVEIINALDTAVSSESILRVFAIQHADAKELASVLKELFQPTQQPDRNLPSQEFNLVGGSDTEGGGDGAKARMVAVADERSNSLVVSASGDMMSMIQQLVKQIDRPVSDLTQLRVFHLINADPTEMASTLAGLFPDATKAGENSSQQIQFDGGPFAGASLPGNAPPGDSEGMKRKGGVLSVPDPRTASIIVSAASELMPQIAGLIASLDANPARKQKVFVYELKNGDAQSMTEILSGMFQNQNSRSSQGNSSQNNALMNRMNRQSSGGATTSFGGRNN